MSCVRCGSYAINHRSHGRDGSDGDLCDVCYWRKRAEIVPPTLIESLECSLEQARLDGRRVELPYRHIEELLAVFAPRKEKP